MSLTVTEQAAAALKQHLEMQDRDADQVLRLVSDEAGNHGFRLDSPKVDDQVVHYDGEAVMVIEPSITEELADKVLDLQETPSGVSLTLYTK
jgi:Fe-S cluster assembly iron-binding protein IscA